MKHELCKNYEKMYNSSVSALIQYLKDNKNIKSLIIGISGGIDSAVTTAIATDERVYEAVPVLVIGRSLPMSPTKIDETRRAELIGSTFCDEFKTVPLEAAFKDLIKNIERDESKEISFEEKVRLGNIRARLRMIQLYHLAHKNNGIVLSTDNLTEFYLGFWTLHGDVGDFGPIQTLWKSEVYGIATYLCDQYISNKQLVRTSAMFDCINAVPTDGLGITESDLDQIQADSYFEADKILIEYLNGNILANETHPVIKRYNNTHFKRENPVSIPRELLID